jgi:hypothetical protein
MPVAGLLVDAPGRCHSSFSVRKPYSIADDAAGNRDPCCLPAIRRSESCPRADRRQETHSGRAELGPPKSFPARSPASLRLALWVRQGLGRLQLSPHGDDAAPVYPLNVRERANLHWVIALGGKSIRLLHFRPHRTFHITARPLVLHAAPQ